MKIKTNAEIDLDDLAFSLDYDKAMNVIKAMDAGQENLEFTHEAAIWFVNELLSYGPEWLEDIRKVIDGVK